MPTTALLKIMGAEDKVVCVQGGQGAGKTTGILMILIDYCKRNSDKVVSVVSDTFPNLKKGAIRDFQKIMKAMNCWSDDSWNGSSRNFTFPNNSIIEFFSLDKETSGLGARRDVLYINEANRVSFKTYNFLAGRTHDRIYIDFNPIEKFWAHTELIDRDACDFISVTYKDNEMLPFAEIDFIEEKKEWAKTSEYWLNWWKVFGLGEIGTLVEGTLYANSFSRRKHVGETEIDFGKLFLAFDFNVNPMTCTFIESARIHGVDTVQVHAELEVEDSDVWTFCQTIKKSSFSKYLHRIFITGDPAGHNRSVYSKGAMTAFQIIQQELNLPNSVILAPKAHLSHVNYRLLLNLAFEKLDITINPSCTSFIYDLEHVTIGKDQKPIKHRRNDAANMDFLDGFLYFLQTEYYDVLL